MSLRERDSKIVDNPDIIATLNKYLFNFPQPLINFLEMNYA